VYLQNEGAEPLHAGGPVADTAAAKNVRTVWNFIVAKELEDKKNCSRDERRI